MGQMNWLDLLSSERLQVDPCLDGAYQTSFERDYGRLIQSASFRRLQDKTQVFPLDESDFVRTRLTHSLEVSAMARSLGRFVVQELYFRGLAPELSEVRANELCEVLHGAALVHDIGNPPFGHYGETSIRDWFRRALPILQVRDRSLAACLTPAQQADFLHFEGNAQALRVLTKLPLSKAQEGMNLTVSLLNTILKYPVSSLEMDPESRQVWRHKMGYFEADRELFQAIVQKTGTSGARHPLTYLLEAADDLTYRTADVEDGHRKGHFSLGQLIEDLRRSPRLEAYDEAIQARYLNSIHHLEQASWQERGQKRHKPDQYALQHWVGELRRDLLADCATSFAESYKAIMQGQYDGTLMAGRYAGLVLDALGDLAYDHIFSSRPIVQMEISANTIIGGLLDKFVPAAISWQTDLPQSSLEPRLMSIISDNYKTCYERESKGKSEEEKLYLRLLLVTDYLSGMTDGFAVNLYHKMHGMAKR